MKKQIDIRFLVLLLVLVAVGVFRVLTTGKDMGPWVNFSPIGAMALFAGAYFSNQYKAFLTPVIILLVSDLMIMQLIYPEYSNGFLYDGWYWTYISFATMVGVGVLFRGQKFLQSVVFGGLLAGVVHFLISNFGVWLGGLAITGQPYPKTFSGLMMAYVAGIPFFKNLLLGNLIYGFILFGGFELLKAKIPTLQLVRK